MFRQWRWLRVLAVTVVIISSVSTNLDLQLGEGTRFEITSFAGLP